MNDENILELTDGGRSGESRSSEEWEAVGTGLATLQPSVSAESDKDRTASPRRSLSPLVVVSWVWTLCNGSEADAD